MSSIHNDNLHGLGRHENIENVKAEIAIKNLITELFENIHNELIEIASKDEDLMKNPQLLTCGHTVGEMYLDSVKKKIKKNQEEAGNMDESLLHVLECPVHCENKNPKKKLGKVPDQTIEKIIKLYKKTFNEDQNVKLEDAISFAKEIETITSSKLKGTINFHANSIGESAENFLAAITNLQLSDIEKISKEEDIKNGNLFSFDLKDRATQQLMNVIKKISNKESIEKEDLSNLLKPGNLATRLEIKKYLKAK